MKRFYGLPITLLFLTALLSGCTIGNVKTTSPATSEYRDWLYLSHDNSFRTELLDFMNEFTVILTELKSIETNDQYIAGRIDGFVSRENYAIQSILTKENMDTEIYKKLMNSELHDPLENLISNAITLLSEIRQNGLVVKKENLEELIILSKEFDTGNSNQFVDTEKSKEILKTIEEMNEIIQGEIS